MTRRWSSTGGTVVATSGTTEQRVAKAVLIATVFSNHVENRTNMEVFDNMRSGLMKDRCNWRYNFTVPIGQVSRGRLDQFWLWSMQAGLKNAYESIKAFSETDFTEDLEKDNIPTLVMHGEDDPIVPVEDAAVKSAGLIKGAKEIYLSWCTARPYSHA